LIDWLRRLGADAAVIAAEFDRLNAASTLESLAAPNVGSSSTPDSPSAAQRMEAILFHPVTSIRRALILSLGNYGTNSLSSDEGDRLIAKLLDLYKNDPDAGIHGAAEWTLRQWNQLEKLNNAVAELSNLKDRGARRWFVNSEGQTFAVIDGPVEFQMGSAPNEPGRAADEVPHRRLVPRRFAIAFKEVSVKQYERFVQSKSPQFKFSRSFLEQYSLDADGPMVAPTWFEATAYCNWLSKQEGLPEEEWCYLPNERDEYDVGMTIPADALKRSGYRLPAEAEWEYACRAGAATSRYHGLSIGLLEAYARYGANSNDHAWSCGSLRPNDLGLFDMLGNVFEWCQDRYQDYNPGAASAIGDDILNIRENRLLRGGAFNDHPLTVRAALRNRYKPDIASPSYGFRLARTNK
jgi:formylglycine-generating enzyme required for sulfatase activity